MTLPRKTFCASPLPNRRMALEELLRRRARASLATWCETALAPLRQKPASHHRLLIERLESVSRGDIDRLMVLMPPGSAKSTYVSVLFPSWFFAQHPGSAIIGASHTAELAEDFSGRVQGFIADHAGTLGYGLRTESRSLWETTNGCRYRAAGVGGAVTGFRADLAIIDDPVRSRKDADSETYRATAWNWFRSDLSTRLKPAGRIVLVMTRWHEDDLGGRLLLHAPGRWHVLKLPALATAADDPLGREINEPLWPAWQDEAFLADQRQQLGERDWASLYQQDPRPMEGGLFKVAQLGTVDAAPAGGQAVRAWDLAATAQTGTRNPDWSVGLKLQRNEAQFTVLDVVRFRGGPDEVERAILATAQTDGRRVAIGLPQDPGQAGKSQVLYFTSKLLGYRVESSPESGDKALRAMPAASQVNVGNFDLLRAGWNSEFREELQGFPSGSKDDQVDALSRAFSMLVKPATPARMVPFDQIGWGGLKR